MKFFEAKWKRWTFVLIVAVVVLPGGYWGARKLVWPKVKSWRAERMNKEARDFLAQGDNANALLTARKILATPGNGENLEAWRIATAAARKRGGPDVIGYQYKLARLEPTKENYLELLRLALQYGPPAYADEAIKAIGAKANDDPEFHALAAQFYRRIGKPINARYALIALTQLRPSDRQAQLDLAELEMADDPERKDRSIRTRVQDLAAADPTLRVRALTLLLRESVKARLLTETRELVQRLQVIPDLSIEDRLLLLEGTSLLEGPSLGALEKLQADVAEKPDDVVRVLRFLRRTGQPEKAVAWAGTLSDEVKKNENVRIEVAESLFVQAKWPELEAHLKAAAWPNREFLRQTLLAYSYRARGRTVDFNDAWKSAVVNLSTERRDQWKIEELRRRMNEWKWTDEQYDVIWKMFAIEPKNPLIQQSLINWERIHGRTANLNRLYTRIVEVDPSDPYMRNNLAYTSLLLDLNVARANLLAEELVGKMPKDPFVVTTYAFSLFKQGKPADALAKIETLSAADLAVPDRVLLRAAFLARAGQSERAEQMLKGIDAKRLLPEERQLRENAFTDIARNARSQEDKNRLGALKQGAGAAGGWLALVSAETRTAATVEMQLTDSLYAGADWAALHAALRKADWKNEDYLRLALQAYAYRAQNDVLQSRDMWKRALVASNRNATRATNLKLLATQWNWPAERVDAMNIIFEQTPTDRALLGELLKHYRDSKSTSDLLRVVKLYVNRTSDTTDEAVVEAYYSLISGTNISRARVLAQKAYEKAPNDPTRRMVYVLSLWKEGRTSEANGILAGLKSGGVSDLVPGALLRAGIDADLGQGEEARTNLALFNPENALPEEVALADKIALQLSKQSDAGKSPKS
jgi:cellulose synthase operon protein C